MPIKINKAFVLERRFRPPVPELHWWETQLLQAIVDHVIVARADSESGITFDDVLKLPEPGNENEGACTSTGTFGELVDELCWNIRENVERSERKRRWYEEEPTRPSADAP
mgnify:CR=1 FL=1